MKSHTESLKAYKTILLKTFVDKHPVLVWVTSVTEEHEIRDTQETSHVPVGFYFLNCAIETGVFYALQSTIFA